MHIGIISDTHFSRSSDFNGLITKLRNNIFDEVELIIHAGDVTNIAFIKKLEEIAPVEAVCGNVDDSTIYEKYETYKSLKIKNIKIGISHKLPNQSFIEQEKLKIVISGHTHVPSIKENENGVLLLNPGSPTSPRIPPMNRMYQYQRLATPSVIILNIDDETSSAFIVSFRLS